MRIRLKLFDWISDKQSFQVVLMKIPYFSLAQRKVPKETGLFARPVLKKPSRKVAQEYDHPTFSLCRSASGGTMPTPYLKL
jgi:hypothetical protein